MYNIHIATIFNMLPCSLCSEFKHACNLQDYRDCKMKYLSNEHMKVFQMNNNKFPIFVLYCT